MTTPVIIEGYCLTYRGGKNIYVLGFFDNGTKVDPMPFNLGIRGGKPAGRILGLKELDYGLWLRAEITGGRDALVGYSGLSVTLSMSEYSGNSDRFIIRKAHLMGINIVTSYKRKDWPKAIPFTTFSVVKNELGQVDLFGEVA